MGKIHQYFWLKSNIYKPCFIFLFLFSCVSNDLIDIKKSANYEIGGYKIFVNSPDGYCINKGSSIKKKKSLQFILTDCIDKPSLSVLKRRPISSIFFVNILYEPGLNYLNTISELVKNAGGIENLESIFSENGARIKNSFVKDGVLFLSLEEPRYNSNLNTGKKFWKALTLYDNVLITFTTYGFSKKASNRSAHSDLEKKLKSMINAVKIIKNDL